MDRRQRKTRVAISKAFNRLLEKKRYENITVQEIIDEADIGRTTFYAHFETKDELLRSMCTDIFHHVFTDNLSKESDHDYATGLKNLEVKLGHILYHLKENEGNLTGILTSESGEPFMRFFREYLKDLFLRYREEFRFDVPEDYLLCYLTGSFVETVKWWITSKESCTPEEAAGFFMTVIGKACKRTESGDD